MTKQHKAKPPPHGDFPPTLYRVLKEEQHARAFADQGKIRFVNLQHCANTEDAMRRDATEGDGFIRFKTDEMITVHIDPHTFEDKGQTVGPGVMNYSSSSLNPRFILCFSSPPGNDIDQLPSKFGSWVVKINDPRQLALDIHNHLEAQDQLDFPLESARVRYDRGALLDKQLPDEERYLLPYAYKPPSFADEHEYRFILMTGMSDPPIPKEEEFWEIDLGRRLDYVEVISLPE